MGRRSLLARSITRLSCGIVQREHVFTRSADITVKFLQHNLILVLNYVLVVQLIVHVKYGMSRQDNVYKHYVVIMMRSWMLLLMRLEVK